MIGGLSYILNDIMKHNKKLIEELREIRKNSGNVAISKNKTYTEDTNYTSSEELESVNGPKTKIDVNDTNTIDEEELDWEAKSRTSLGLWWERINITIINK